MDRAKARDTGWQVFGYHFPAKDKHYIMLIGAEVDYHVAGDYDYISDICFCEIDPTTLARDTTVKDKNGNAVYGSFEVDGVMSEGGDKVRGDNKQLLEPINVGTVVWDIEYLCWAFQYDITKKLLRIYDMTSLVIIDPACDVKEDE